MSLHLLCTLNESNYSEMKSSIYLKFESCSHVGYRGGLTVVTSELHCSQSSTSLWRGSDCNHFRTSLQSKFNCNLGGVQLQSLQNFTAVKVQLHFGGGFNYSHFRTSLQPKFNFTLGGGLTAVTSELHCRQTSTSLWRGGLTAVTSELHCRQTSTSLRGGISVPLSHSVRSTGWPLVISTY